MNFVIRLDNGQFLEMSTIYRKKSTKFRMERKNRSGTMNLGARVPQRRERFRQCGVFGFA